VFVICREAASEIAKLAFAANDFNRGGHLVRHEPSAIRTSIRVEENSQMFHAKRFISAILLAAASLAPLAVSGCAARVRVYDEYHSDYHYWNDREDHAYRLWLAERHYQYREFARLNHEEQRDYWNWRHSRPDAER